MHSAKTTLFVPILVIALGTGWLLTALDVAPRIDWAWTLSLAGLGLLTFAMGGVDKATVVVGPFLLAASCLSVLRQGGSLPVNVEVPILVILCGVLLLVARSPRIPTPRWVLPETDAGAPGS
ncbi:MAG: hypothetical protein AB7O97_05290 [Planctomycetota bacterium]